MVKTKKQLVSSRKNTFNGTNKRLYITIHETGNTSKGANAQAHANLQSNGFANTFHWQVDDKQAIQSFPHTVQCWHAGDGRGSGNLNSIGIEICVNSDGDYVQAVKNAAALTRKIMAEENIPLNRVVQHNHWSGKNCPAGLRAGKQGLNWHKFISLVKGVDVEQASKPQIKPKPQAKPSTSNKKSVAQMAKEVLAGKHGNGHAARQKSLGISNAEYAKVRAEVNRIAAGGKVTKPKPSKTIKQMANEVVKGLHGNGHAQRQKSLGVDIATYAKVRAEVNKRF